MPRPATFPDTPCPLHPTMIWKCRHCCSYYEKQRSRQRRSPEFLRRGIRCIEPNWAIGQPYGLPKLNWPAPELS